jgi:hypothetical protein
MQPLLLLVVEQHPEENQQPAKIDGLLVIVRYSM